MQLFPIFHFIMMKKQFLTYRDLKATMIAIIFYTDIIAEQIADFCKTRVFRGCTKIAMYKCNTCERTETSFHFCYSCSKHHFQLLHENTRFKWDVMTSEFQGSITKRQNVCFRFICGVKSCLIYSTSQVPRWPVLLW